jgi:cysteate synthase
VDPNETVMLNITGGGELHFKDQLAARGGELHYLKPSVVFPLNPSAEEVVAAVERLF